MSKEQYLECEKCNTKTEHVCAACLDDLELKHGELKTALVQILSDIQDTLRSVGVTVAIAVSPAPEGE